MALRHSLTKNWESLMPIQIFKQYSTPCTFHAFCPCPDSNFAFTALPYDQWENEIFWPHVLRKSLLFSGSFLKNVVHSVEKYNYNL